MQSKVIALNLKASKLSFISGLVSYTGLGCACLLHPHPMTGLLLLPVFLVAVLHWYWNLGPGAPKQLLWRAGSWWLVDAQGEELLLSKPLRWRSYLWVSLSLPGRPWGFKTWLLWPDSLTREQQHQLRAFLTF